jgi:hypothetical protein
MYFRLKHHYQIKVITFDVVFIAIIPKTTPSTLGDYLHSLAGFIQFLAGSRLWLCHLDVVSGQLKNIGKKSVHRCPLGQGGAPRLWRGQVRFRAGAGGSIFREQ